MKGPDEVKQLLLISINEAFRCRQETWAVWLLWVKHSHKINIWILNTHHNHWIQCLSLCLIGSEVLTPWILKWDSEVLCDWLMHPEVTFKVLSKINKDFLQTDIYSKLHFNTQNTQIVVKIEGIWPQTRFSNMVSISILYQTETFQSPSQY